MKKEILKNELVVLCERRKTDSVAIEILIKVGSDDEQNTERGITHFIEHMAFEGTTTRNAQQLANEIESVGGEMNGVTTHERTFFYAVVPKQHFKMALNVLADALINQLFDEDAIEKEKNVIIDEMKMISDNPVYFSWIKLLSEVFKKIPAKHPVYGNEKNITAFDRRKIIAFFKRYYVAANTIITIVGDVSNPFAAVEQAFRAMPQGQRNEVKQIPEPPQRKKKVKYFHKDIEHAYVALGFKAPKMADKDFYALEVVKAILSKGQSSRLFTEVRTRRGLAYVIGAEYEANTHFGCFAVYFSSDPGKIPQILEIIDKQRKLEGLSKRELNDAKEYLIGNFILANEHNRERADSNASWFLLQKEPREYIQNIKRVSMRDIRVAKKYLHDKYTLVIIKK